MAVVVGEAEKQHLQQQADQLRGRGGPSGRWKPARRCRRTPPSSSPTTSAGRRRIRGELSKEIRENRPINANVLFNDFLGQPGADATFSAEPQGPVRKRRSARQPVEGNAATVFLTDGKQVYMPLLHIAGHRLSLPSPPTTTGKRSARGPVPAGRRPITSSADSLIASSPPIPGWWWCRWTRPPGRRAGRQSLSAREGPLPSFLTRRAGQRQYKGYGEVGFKARPRPARGLRPGRQSVFQAPVRRFRPLARHDLGVQPAPANSSASIDHQRLLRRDQGLHPRNRPTGDNTVAERSGADAGSSGAAGDRLDAAGQSAVPQARDQLGAEPARVLVFAAETLEGSAPV